MFAKKGILVGSPFPMPTRLAVGLGPGSDLGSYHQPFAPNFRVPRASSFGSNRPRLPNEPILGPMSRQSKFHRTTCSLSAAYDDVDRAFAFAAYVVFDYVTVLTPMF